MSKRRRDDKESALVAETKDDTATNEGDAEAAEETETEINEDELLKQFVEERSDEELLTIFSTCRETMRNLRKQFLHEVKPLRDTVNTAKTNLLRHMNDHSLDVLQVDEDKYIRRVLKQGNGRKLVSATLLDVLDGLVSDENRVCALLESVRRERQERLDKWTAKQKRARRGKLGPQATLAAQVIGTAPVPPDPGPRVFGKNKVMRRKLPPISRDLTLQELAAEIAYQAIHDAHRPQRHVLNVSRTLGRGRHSAAALSIASMDDVKTHTGGDEIAKTALRFLLDKDVLSEHSRALSGQRSKHRKMIDMCKDRISQYISTLNPGGRVVRRCFQTENGPCTVSIAVKTKDVKARTLTLWDVSETVDAIAAAVPSDKPRAAEATSATLVAELQACLASIRDGISPIADGLLETRTKTVERVMDRRVRPKQSAAGADGQDGTLHDPADADGGELAAENDEDGDEDEYETELEDEEDNEDDPTDNLEEI